MENNQEIIENAELNMMSSINHLETELAKISSTLAKITEVLKNKGKHGFLDPSSVSWAGGGVMDGLGGILGASWALLEAS